MGFTRTRKGMAVGLVAMTVVACGGNGGNSDAETIDGGHLEWAIADDIGCVDYRQTTYRSLLQIGRQVTDSLVYMDDEGEAHPWLAEDWEINEEGTEYTFYLRDDVTFTDGSDFTAESVKANMDALHDFGGVMHFAQEFLEHYEGTEVVDDHTAVIRFAEPNAPFLYAVSTPNFGIYSDETAGAEEGALCAGDYVTTGSYTIEDYVPSERTYLTRNDDYAWGPEVLENTEAGHIEEMTFNVIEDSYVLSGNAVSGDVDFVLGVTATDVEMVQDAGWENSELPDPALSASFLLNTEANDIVGDEAVRQALVTGVDRETLMAAAGPLNEPATGVLNEAHPFYNDQSDQLQFDPEASIEILEAAGWEEGPDGIRERDGERLTIDTMFYVENALPIMELAQEQLSEIGVELSLNQVTSAEAVAAREEGNWEMRMEWFTGPDPIVLGNVLGWMNAPEEVYEMVNATVVTVDEEERTEVVTELTDAVLEQGIITPLYTQNSTPWHGPNVTGRVADIAGLLMLTQVQLTE